MKKYFVIDTWNGEGYSESKVTIREIDDVPRYLAEFVNGCVGGWGDTVEEAEENGVVLRPPTEEYPLRYEYSIGEDDGAVELVPYNSDVVGIILHPNVNEHTVIDSFGEWEHRKEIIRNGSEEYQEDSNIFDSVHYGLDEEDNDWILFEFRDRQKELVDGVKELLDAVDNNIASLWVDGLEYTVECVVLEEQTIEDVDWNEEEGEVRIPQEYTGINGILDKLQKLIKPE